MQDVMQILKSFGFTESESKTYLTAWEVGPSTVIELTEHTNLSRQTTYLAIEALIQRGLMTSVERGSRNVFAAEPPDKLAAYAQRREQEMKERTQDLTRLLPSLELRGGGNERPSVRMYEGKEAILAMIDELQKTASAELYEIADLDAMRQLVTEKDLEPIRHLGIPNDRRVHGLYPPLPDGRPFTNQDAYILPEQFRDFHGNITIFGNKTILVSFEGKTHSIVIDSAGITNALRVLFRLGIRGLSMKNGT